MGRKKASATTIATSILAAVKKGSPIPLDEAIARRKNGQDVVVCGLDLGANRRLAGHIEQSANGSSKRCHRRLGHDRCRTINRTLDHPRDMLFMKPIIERPCDQTMRFFTPELYRQFNSADEEVADLADTAWEKALADYEKHLAGIKDRLPSLVRSLAELRLHDAEVVAPIEEIASGGSGPTAEVVTPLQTPTRSAMAVMTVKHQGEFVTLIYNLWDRIRQDAPPSGWPFSPYPVYWLYDELDLSADAKWPIIHRVLFSDGTVIEVPFQSVAIHKFSFSVANRTASAAS